MCEHMSRLLILIFLVAAIVVLQIYLSKKKNKWLGLILPFIAFSISLMALLDLATFYNVGSVHVESQTVTENGVVTKQVIEEPIKTDTSKITQSIFIGCYILILYNISTVILLLIYKGAREKLKKEIELRKMNIQDLE